ncbi:hypothetical protein IQ238_15325 [Pleurocapsales cyanobacterium LEGE 06147]|nr:hypothetical protein [Pleurocapsales cyanobacterium LEGE 06147]
MTRTRSYRDESAFQLFPKVKTASEVRVPKAILSPRMSRPPNQRTSAIATKEIHVLI